MHSSCEYPYSWNRRKMYSVVNTATVVGIHTIPIQVEVDISTGMPVFDLVGYLSSEVKEAKERVKTALHNCDVVLPAKRITMNLAPANIRKTGTGFDLPMAVALLVALGIAPGELCEDTIFVGELNLKGQILPVKGVLPMVSDGMKSGIKNYVVPLANEKEAKLVKGANVYAFSDLKVLMSSLINGKLVQSDFVNDLTSNIEETCTKEMEYDFADVNGQAYIKKACEIAAAGMHNILLIGPPGAGKTMLCERMASILPPLTEEEKLELSKIYSVCGLLTNYNALLSKRPFRSPHHTITTSGLAGGGMNPRPGEISLAHHGVLFLDELPEFHKTTLEVLRQPLEERVVHIARNGGSVTYPSNFLLMAAMNPCKCGYYPDRQKCRCTPAMLKNYMNRVSQPLIDRIDICVEAQALSYQDLIQKNRNESSEEIQKRVIACHQIQRERFNKEKYHYNSEIPSSDLKKYCHLNEEQEKYMENMFDKWNLTARTYHRILRVSRTIADLDGSPIIRMTDLQQAVSLRGGLEEKYMGDLR